MTVAIQARLLEAIADERSARHNVELCGLLLAGRGSATVDHRLAYDGPQMSRCFSLSQDWLLGAFLRQRELGRKVVGYYHTHPDGSALSPSLSDLEGHPPGSLVLLLGNETGSEVGWRVWRANVQSRGWRAVDSVAVSS